jgi:hypothetical protein
VPSDAPARLLCPRRQCPPAAPLPRSPGLALEQARHRLHPALLRSHGVEGCTLRQPGVTRLQLRQHGRAAPGAAAPSMQPKCVRCRLVCAATPPPHTPPTPSPPSRAAALAVGHLPAAPCALAPVPLPRTCSSFPWPSDPPAHLPSCQAPPPPPVAALACCAFSSHLSLSLFAPNMLLNARSAVVPPPTLAHPPHLLLLPSAAARGEQHFIPRAPSLPRAWRRSVSSPPAPCFCTHTPFICCIAPCTTVAVSTRSQLTVWGSRASSAAACTASAGAAAGLAPTSAPRPLPVCGMAQHTQGHAMRAEWRRSEVEPELAGRPAGPIGIGQE